MSLRVEGLSKSFRQGERSVEVLREASFEAREGESIAIVGQSGSGKSTLLALLAGLDRPDSGLIELEGRDLLSLDEVALSQWRADRLGIVFQQFHLMAELTALENVGLPLELKAQPLPMSEIRQKSREALDRVGLGFRATHLPRQLSGGECQRVAIARALITSPSILLADEPTGNLDGTTAAQVADLMFELTARSRTVLILVTHSEELAKRCTRVLRLRSGRIEV